MRAIGLLLLVACSKELVPVIPDGTPQLDPTFEVVARVAGASDPLSVEHASVAYADLERALGRAVSTAVTPRHDMVLTVELVAAEASYHEGRLAVSLVARATLRTRIGNAFIAQTTVVCRDGAFVDPEAGAKVMWSCMTRLGHDLGGWLAALPEAHP